MIESLLRLTVEQERSLSRLGRGIRIGQDGMTWERLNPAGQALLRWATYSIYCDCIDIGVELDARQLLKSHRSAAG